MLGRNGCKVVVLCALTAAAIAVGSVQTARSNSTNEALTFNGDGAQRSNQIHWPDGFHPEQTDLFAHNKIFVHASCKKVFTNLADAQAWPSWYPNSHDVKLLNSLDGKLHRGTRFSSDTFGVHIESTAHEFVPDSRLGWKRHPHEGLSHVPFVEEGEGCRIVTEEVVNGPRAIDFREKQPAAMQEGHDLWLSTLKQRFEQ